MSVWFDQRPHWDLTVCFSYEVNGKMYSGRQQWYTDSTYREKAQTERLNYLLGKKQYVYYDPSDPSRSLIESARTTIRESDTVFIASGVASVLGATGMWVFTWRRKWMR